MDAVTASNAKAENVRSAWKRGVGIYAIELLDSIDDVDFSKIKNRNELETCLLNNCDNWSQYSYVGNSLCYDWEIIQRTFPKSLQERALKSCNAGNYYPLDDQARALYQAFNRVARCWQRLKNEGSSC